MRMARDTSLRVGNADAGEQIAEALRLHRKLDRKAAWTAAIQAMEEVSIPSPERRANDYPHQLSGGMNQRVMIAMAIACNPRLLIADEPTTALDVTIQAQILDLLRKLQNERGMALVLVTHNMGVVSEMARRVVVMYAGQIVEERAADSLFNSPQHPYTAALLQTVASARTGGAKEPFEAVAGQPPSDAVPPGCPFHPRCPHALPACVEAMPAATAVAPGHDAACHLLGSAA